MILSLNVANWRFALFSNRELNIVFPKLHYIIWSFQISLIRSDHEIRIFVIIAHKNYWKSISTWDCHVVCCPRNSSKFVVWKVWKSKESYSSCDVCSEYHCAVSTCVMSFVFCFDAAGPAQTGMKNRSLHFQNTIEVSNRQVFLLISDDWSIICISNVFFSLCAFSSGLLHSFLRRTNEFYFRHSLPLLNQCYARIDHVYHLHFFTSIFRSISDFV